MANTSWLIVIFGDAESKLAEAAGSWSGIEGSQVSEESPAGPIRAESTRGG